MSQAEPGAPASQALIWVGGLFKESMDQSVEGFARRFAVALDVLDSSPAVYEVRTEAEATDARAAPAPSMCSIVRTSNGSESRLDVYGLATEETLVGGIQRRQLALRLLLLAGVLVRHGPRMWHLLQRRGKSPRERAQVIAAQAWSVLLLGSFVILLGSLAATFAAGDIPWLPKWGEAVVLAVGGLSIWKSKLFQGLADSGLVAAGFVRYIDRPGDRDRALRGEFYGLLDELQRRSSYQRIDAVAFSFGSLAVINACFPATDSPPGVVGTVHRVVTLGCPFDFVRAYWPRYFEDRFSAGEPCADWINVYSPGDVLSSNFADGEGPDADFGIGLNPTGGGAPADPVKPRNVLYRLDGVAEPPLGLRTLLLEGLRMHGAYWDEEDPDGDTVFRLIATELGFATRRTEAGGAAAGAGGG